MTFYKEFEIVFFGVLVFEILLVLIIWLRERHIRKQATLNKLDDLEP